MYTIYSDWYAISIVASKIFIIIFKKHPWVKRLSVLGQILIRSKQNYL